MPSFGDILLIVLGFEGNFAIVPFEKLDIGPCEANGLADFNDIHMAVLAFEGNSYFDYCPDLCP
jgi:hypothetical protein